MGYLWSDVYKLENGNLLEIGRWDGHSSDIDRETGEWIELAPDDIVEVIDDGRQLNGTGVTREQYEQTINSYLGGTQWQGCIDEKLEELLE